jgi:hypothetical protein
VEIKKNYALEPFITDRSMGWHYTDVHAGGPIGAVYLTWSITGAGIDRIPNGSTFMNETIGGKAIRKKKTLYAAGTNKPIGKMVFAYGHVKGENVHGWMALSNMRKNGKRLQGFIPCSGSKDCAAK